MNWDNALLRYARPVPRYTSYPTATQFTGAIGPSHYARWLASLEGQSLSLYIHVPFCQALCWFCGCTTTVAKSAAVSVAYASLLVEEISRVAFAIGGAGAVRHIHWGGGTPTQLGISSLRRVLERVRARFDVSDDAEVAIELDPRTLTRETIEALPGLGFNRVSLGVQDVDPAVQTAINRIQPIAFVREAASCLRDNGISWINVDLMVGLPRQTEGSVRRSAAATIEALRPSRVAIFSYAHMPWLKRHQRLIDASALPGPRERLSQALAAAEVLEAMGYLPLGLDHFALPGDRLELASKTGKLRRNFQGYTDDTAAVLLGIGASAIGSLPSGYVQNESRVVDYRRAIERGGFAIARGIALDDDDRVRRDIIERLMCDLRVDLDDTARRWNVDRASFDDDIAALGPLVDDGLVRLSGRRVEVDPSARSLVRSVAATFDRYLSPAPMHHFPEFLHRAEHSAERGPSSGGPSGAMARDGG
ncbi:MAG: oxygen-independent coproporphyrinogen III oxidase [Bauldia sp.]|nr:oxygen-independent coproporphyrinogen III oxidase [Bauldia sp.]